MPTINDLTETKNIIKNYTEKGNILFLNCAALNPSDYNTDQNYILESESLDLSTIIGKYTAVVLVNDNSVILEELEEINLIKEIQSRLLISSGKFFYLILKDNYVMPRYIRTGADNLTKQVTEKLPNGKWPFQFYVFYN